MAEDTEGGFDEEGTGVPDAVLVRLAAGVSDDVGGREGVPEFDTEAELAGVPVWVADAVIAADLVSE